MFRVRLLATQEEIALIAKAARKQGLSVPQFVTRVARNLGSKLKAFKQRRCCIPKTDEAPAPKAEVVLMDNRYRTVVSATIRKS